MVRATASGTRPCAVPQRFRSTSPTDHEESARQTGSGSAAQSTAPTHSSHDLASTDIASSDRSCPLPPRPTSCPSRSSRTSPSGSRHWIWRALESQLVWSRGHTRREELPSGPSNRTHDSVIRSAPVSKAASPPIDSRDTARGPHSSLSGPKLGEIEGRGPHVEKIRPAITRVTRAVAPTTPINGHAGRDELGDCPRRDMCRPEWFREESLPVLAISPHAGEPGYVLAGAGLNSQSPPAPRSVTCSGGTSHESWFDRSSGPRVAWS